VSDEPGRQFFTACVIFCALALTAFLYYQGVTEEYASFLSGKFAHVGWARIVFEHVLPFIVLWPFTVLFGAMLGVIAWAAISAIMAMIAGTLRLVWAVIRYNVVDACPGDS
jgi:hypothetical protein